ncbi:MAG: hypothetical protein RMY29_012360 [Nostoc sp. CreGUA01]|nr:hypothetical protein [Nostoc sp. CreGUA01]
MANGAWGMAKKLPMPNAQCPMPQATGRLSLSTHEGMEFPIAFNEASVTLVVRVEVLRGSDVYDGLRLRT